jgi:threonine dehydrogenase-like Zn-dependent dehydrogenase
MKAIVNTAPGRLEWLDWPTPQPKAGQVLIRTAACAICATDLEMIGGWARTGFPSIPGHEWSGVVGEVGPRGDTGLLGRPCVAENVLADGGEVGFEHPGGYGQFLLTEARNVRPLPQGFAMDQAALIEPLAVCVRAMRRLRPENLRSALVLGDGPIGLLMLALLHRAGGRRLALVGGRPVRLAVAKELGAAATINYHDAGGGLADAIAQAPGAPFPNIVEASGSAAAMALALEVAARGARVLVLGDYGNGRADFPWNHLLHRELELIGSNASAGAWDEAVRLAIGGEVPLGRLISHRLPARRFPEALDLARSNRDVVKVVLDWSQER